MVIKHPTTQAFTTFYASRHKDGHLCEGSPSGSLLPPLRSRGKINRAIPLNPILVNFAAMLRFRRLIRQDYMWGSTLSIKVIDILRHVAHLHEAVKWEPNQPMAPELIVEFPDRQPLNLCNWHGAPQPISSAPGLNQGTETNNPPTALECAFAMLEEGNPSCVDQFASQSDCVCAMQGLWIPWTCTATMTLNPTDLPYPPTWG